MCHILSPSVSSQLTDLCTGGEGEERASSVLHVNGVLDPLG